MLRGQNGDLADAGLHTSMKVTVVPVTPFAQNCTLLWREETRRAAIVDPGGEIERILEAADQAHRLSAR